MKKLAIIISLLLMSFVTLADNDKKEVKQATSTHEKKSSKEHKEDKVKDFLEDKREHNKPVSAH